MQQCIYNGQRQHECEYVPGAYVRALGLLTSIAVVMVQAKIH